MEHYAVDLRVVAKSDSDIIRKLKHIEKHTFPRSEALDFDTELKKLNTTLLIAVIANEADKHLLGYCVFARVGRDVLLHKICVAPFARLQGIADRMLQHIRQTVAQTSDQMILWVDEKRTPARRLYEKCGYEKVDYSSDYYGPGRHGIKMRLWLEAH